MRVARWRWQLFPIVVAVAGCLPQPTPALPADLLAALGDGATFTVQTPAVGATGQDVAAALRAGQPAVSMFSGRVVPVFGIVECHGDPACSPGPGGAIGGPPRTVWVLLYPDCTDTSADPGWAIVDAVNGVDGAYVVNASCS